MGKHCLALDYHAPPTVPWLDPSLMAHNPMFGAALRAVAALPPALKSHFTARVGNRLLSWAAAVPGDFADIRGNLGVHRRLRLQIPPRTLQRSHLCGTPTAVHGEGNALRLILALARRTGCFLDVGAHVGIFSYSVATATSARVLAFEPNPALVAMWRANLAANPWVGIAFHPEAVGDRDGIATFHVDTRDSLQSTLTQRDGPDIESVDVAIRRLDSVVTEAKIDAQQLCIKADVENAEAQLIAGAAHTLQQAPDLVIELLMAARQAGLPARLMSEFGLRAFYLHGNCADAVSADDGRYSPGEYNWWFTRRPIPELHAIAQEAGLTLNGL